MQLKNALPFFCQSVLQTSFWLVVLQLVDFSDAALTLEWKPNVLVLIKTIHKSCVMAGKKISSVY